MAAIVLKIIQNPDHNVRILNSPGVDFMNGFAPLHPTFASLHPTFEPNFWEAFYWRKCWAQGAKDRRKTVYEIDPSYWMIRTIASQNWTIWNEIFQKSLDF